MWAYFMRVCEGVSQHWMMENGIHLEYYKHYTLINVSSLISIFFIKKEPKYKLFLTSLVHWKKAWNFFYSILYMEKLCPRLKTDLKLVSLSL